MNRERIAEVIVSSSLWALGKDSYQALSELVESIYALQKADRIIAEEGKESPFIEPTNAGDPFPYRKSRATSKLKKQPQQPKLPEKLPEFLMEIDRHGLYKKTINEILDYLKGKE